MKTTSVKTYSFQVETVANELAVTAIEFLILRRLFTDSCVVRIVVTT